MQFCPYCGSKITEQGAFCTNCGAPLGSSQPAASGQPVSEMPASEGYQSPGQQSEPYQPIQQPFTAFQQSVTPYATGGLLAWSIVCILLCLIPGVVALTKTLSINKSATVEEQQGKISSARTWCIIATVLGVISWIGTIASNH